MNAYLKKTPTRRQRAQAFRKLFVSGTFRAGLLVCIALFGVLYLFEVNAVSTQGFAISDLEDTITVLEQENRKLNVQIASYRSMDSIESRLADMGLVNADNIVYVTPVGTAVARR